MQRVWMVATLTGALLVLGAAPTTGAPAGPGTNAAPVPATWPFPPEDRSATVLIDSQALLDQLVDLPEPFPTPSPPEDCRDLPAHPGTFPLFDGATVTIAGTTAQLCEGFGGWTVSWNGANTGPGGATEATGSTVTVLDPDGTLRGGFLINLTVGTARYEYTPDYDDPASNEYTLRGFGTPDPLVTIPRPTTTSTTASAPAPTDTVGAAPAVAVAGAPGYTG